MQLVLHADWHEVWHSPQPPLLTVFLSIVVLSVLICFIVVYPPSIKQVIFLEIISHHACFGKCFLCLMSCFSSSCRLKNFSFSNAKYAAYGAACNRGHKSGHTANAHCEIHRSRNQNSKQYQSIYRPCSHSPKYSTA